MIHNSQFKTLALVITIGLLTWPTSTNAQESSWPQFLGPSGTSETSTSKPPTSWDESNFVWQTEIPGTGWSSPVYENGRIWLTTATTEPATEEQLARKREGVQFAEMKTTVGQLNLFAICVDLESGKTLHKISLAKIEEPSLINPFNSYASPTPAIDDGKVICHFGNYGTWCLDAETGKEIWKTEFVIDHSVGAGSSPVIHNGKVLIVCDGIDEQYVAAVALSTGESLWKTHRPDFRNENGEQQKAYCTPLIAEINGHTQAIIPGAQWIIAYNPDDGQEIWRADHSDGFSVTPMASLESGLVIMATGYMKSEFVAVDPTGNGDVSQSHIKWRANQAPNMPSMVSAGGRLYAVSDKGILSCIDAASGKVLKRRRVGGNYSSSLLLAGGHLYLCSREGQVSIIKCDDELTEVGKENFDGKLMATPAPVGNDLLIRTDKKLYRIGRGQG